MLTAERITTIEELWTLSHDPAYADKRLELSQGRLITMSPTGLKHGKYTSLIDRLIGDFVDAHQLGMTTGAETGYILHQDLDGRNTVRAPDVGFIAASRIPADLPDSFAPFAPDLAVEVISPSETATDIYEKVQEYLRYGTRMVLLVYPTLKSAAVYTPSGYQALTIEDAFEGGDVLPGFTLPLRRLFEG